MNYKFALTLVAMAVSTCSCDRSTVNGLEPIPDGLVVLTFDDGNKSDIGFVAPTLQEYGFGASFYITEGLGYKADINKEWYVSWDDVRRLHDLGFEVGNHTAEPPQHGRTVERRDSDES